MDVMNKNAKRDMPCHTLSHPVSIFATWVRFRLPEITKPNSTSSSTSDQQKTKNTLG